MRKKPICNFEYFLLFYEGGKSFNLLYQIQDQKCIRMRARIKMARIQHSISIPQLYRMTVGIDDSQWGIAGYNLPRKYQDPAQNIRKKGIKASPGSKGKKKSYLDDIQKIASSIPGPNAYMPSQSKSLKKIQSKIPILRRLNFIEQIFHNAARNKSPSPCEYNVVQTDQQAKARVAKLKSRIQRPSEKLTYLDSQMSMSIQVPGPGQYSSKPIKKKALLSFISPASKRTVNSEQAQNIGKDSAQVYPYPVSYRLFGKSLDLPSNQLGKNGMGSERRFEQAGRKGDRKNPFPGPASYNLYSQWKAGTKDRKAHPWDSKVSKGQVRSIYY